jgi:RimJ/RimL family protein N-acetyltransferase
MEHIIAYEGVGTSLGIMQKEYIPLYIPWVNRRIGIEGTLQRPPYMLEHGDEFVKRVSEGKGTNETFAILRHEEGVEKPSYRYVGHTGLYRMEWPQGRATTGSMIVMPDSRGKGCGTEAKLQLLYHGFYVVGLRKISSRVKAFNAASMGHLLKCGYQVIGREPKHEFHEGEFIDEVLFCVFREQFEPIWAEYKETKTLPKLTPEQRDLITKEINKK